MSDNHIAPKTSANLENELARRVNDLASALAKAFNHGMITKSQHTSMNRAFVVMVGEWNNAADKFDNLLGELLGRTEDPPPYNGCRNMEADRHEDEEI